LDIGANVGYYSVYCSPLVRRVVSFEPDPRNHDALEDHASRIKNISVCKMALGLTAGDGSLSMGEDSSVSRLTDDLQADNSMLRVSVSTIDQFCAQDGNLHPTGIKLDTEGTELDILRGGMMTIQRTQPLILAELQLGPGENVNELVAFQKFAESIEYRIFAYVQDRPGCIQRGSYRLVASNRLGADFTKMIFLTPKRLWESFEKEAND